MRHCCWLSDRGELQWLYHLWLYHFCDDGGDDGDGDDGDGGDVFAVLAVLAAGAAGLLLPLPPLLPLLMLPLPLKLWRKCCFDKIYYCWMMSLDRDRSCIVRKGGR